MKPMLRSLYVRTREGGYSYCIQPPGPFLNTAEKSMMICVRTDAVGSALSRDPVASWEPDPRISWLSRRPVQLLGLWSSGRTSAVMSLPGRDGAAWRAELWDCWLTVSGRTLTMKKSQDKEWRPTGWSSVSLESEMGQRAFGKCFFMLVLAFLRFHCISLLKLLPEGQDNQRIVCVLWRNLSFSSQFSNLKWVTLDKINHQMLKSCFYHIQTLVLDGRFNWVEPLSCSSSLSAFVSMDETKEYLCSIHFCLGCLSF